MNELPIPFLPTALWFMAAGCLVLLMLVVFGYHLYQRSRVKALARDAGGIASLAAKKETLAAEVAEMRSWLSSQRAEREKLEAERHQQELARVELAQLEKRLEDKKNESTALVARVADLDIGFEKRRQLHARLDAEIRSLEDQRAELVPMEKYAQELRVELDQGRARLAQLAQEEIRAQSLQTQAEILRREMAQLKQELEPLREEKTRLHQFIEQARHSAAVKNEQLLEQKKEQRALESANVELKKEQAALQKEVRQLQEARATAASDLDGLQARIDQSKNSGEQLRQSVLAEQAQLELLIQRCGEKSLEIDAMTARKVVLERELEQLTAPQPKKLEARRPKKRTRFKLTSSARGRRGGIRQRRVELVRCGTSEN